MKVKIIISIFLLISALGGSYYYYQYNYVETLKLSEITGKTDDNVTNIVVNIFDFDTGLTRHDLSQLKSKKDYWIGRMNEVETIIDPNQKQEKTEKLLSEMLEDPTMKKIIKGTFAKTSEFIEQILNKR